MFELIQGNWEKLENLLKWNVANFYKEKKCEFQFIFWKIVQKLIDNLLNIVCAIKLLFALYFKITNPYIFINFNN